MNITDKKIKIGVFDSGIGGLTVLNEIIKVAPFCEYIYLGDTARTPYGNKSKLTIEKFCQEASAFLLSQNIDYLVIACNSASSYGLKKLKDSLDIPIINTITPIIRQLKSIAPSKIAILGTRATIESNQYQDRIKKILHAVKIIAQPCPLFVPIVEEGVQDKNIVNSIIDYYLKNILLFKPEIIVLGCTHYPLLLPFLKEYFKQQTQFIHCGEAIAQELLKNIAPYKKTAINKDLKIFVTDEAERFKNIIKQYFPALKYASLQTIKLDQIP